MQKRQNTCRRKEVLTLWTIGIPYHWNAPRNLYPNDIGLNGLAVAYPSRVAREENALHRLPFPLRNSRAVSFVQELHGELIKTSEHPTQRNHVGCVRNLCGGRRRTL